MTGRYKAYPEHKDSGVEWIGKIPCDWSVWKIFHACPYIASGTTPKSDGNNYYDGENLWVTTGELREGVINDTQKKVTDKALIDIPTLRLHPKGSVAIAMYGATIGRLGIFGKEATTNQACCVMPPSKILHNKFLFYWLYATRQEIINLSSGGGQPNVNQEKIASLKVSAPDYTLQTKIANFLDYETAKADTLIEKQKQLIQLLKEKRQAVITHAVTKGFDPKVKMRESRIEWLGDVPAHWALSQPRFVCSFVGGGTPMKENPEFWDGDIPWVSPKDMKKDYISTAQDKITPAALSQSAVKLIGAGAVLIVVRGMILDHSVPVALSEAKLTINQDMKALIPNAKMDGEYLLYCLKGMRDNILSLVDSSAHGTKCLRTEQFDRMVLPLPPLSEQLSITSQLKDTLSRFDKLILNTELMIELAVERRTALVSAAVTGKIDINDWIAPQAIQINREVAA